MTDELTKVEPSIEELEKAFDGDLDLVLFFVSWIKNGKNATAAYLELHPNVDRTSAQVQGSRQLAKIDRGAVMKCYGLGHEEYFQQLSDGMKAVKSDATGQTYPDHKTRAIYHDKLGKLLGIEKAEGFNITGDKVIAILGGVTVQNVPTNNSTKENT